MTRRAVAAAVAAMIVTSCASASKPVVTSPVAPTVSATASLADLALALAAADHQPARKSTYLAPLRRLQQHCSPSSVPAIEAAVEGLAQGLVATRLVAAPRAVAEAALAADAVGRTSCSTLSAELLTEVAAPVAQTSIGWGGYGGTVSAWNEAHRRDPGRPGSYRPRRHNGEDAYRLVSSGRVLTMYEVFSPPLTAQLALASIRHSLLPGKVRLVYALTAAQCQQAIYMGSTLGRLIGNSTLGAFVELTSGGGVGRSRFDPVRVDRARITPLGRIGGEPCT